MKRYFSQLPWFVLTLPTSQFAYFDFAYMFHFAKYGYDLEGLSRNKTDFDLWQRTRLTLIYGSYRRMELPSQEVVRGDGQKDWDNDTEVQRLHN